MGEVIANIYKMEPDETLDKDTILRMMGVTDGNSEFGISGDGKFAVVTTIEGDVQASILIGDKDNNYSRVTVSNNAHAIHRFLRTWDSGEVGPAYKADHELPVPAGLID